MMRKKEKVITMTVTLILVVILICIKVTHFVIIERPWIVFFFYQIFKRDFPFAAAAYAPGCVYGSMANDGLAKNIVCMLDMFLILFVFGHGKSPFLNNGRGRQHFVLSPS